jgi:hypothetical protein
MKVRRQYSVGGQRASANQNHMMRGRKLVDASIYGRRVGHVAEGEIIIDGVLSSVFSTIGMDEKAFSSEAKTK